MEIILILKNYKEGSENQLKSENKRQNEVLSSAIILMNENDLKEMDYKDSIKKDKRSFLRMFWSFFCLFSNKFRNILYRKLFKFICNKIKFFNL